MLVVEVEPVDGSEFFGIIYAHRVDGYSAVCVNDFRAYVGEPGHLLSSLEEVDVQDAAIRIDESEEMLFFLF